MPAVCLFPSDEGGPIRNQYRERGVPEGLAGVPPAVARAMLARCERCDRILRHMHEVAAKGLIGEFNGYEAAIRASPLRKRMDEMEPLAIRHLADALRNGRLSDARPPLPLAERAVVAKLLCARGTGEDADVETALRERESLDVNEHVAFQNLVRRIFWHLECGRMGRRETPPERNPMAA